MQILNPMVKRRLASGPADVREESGLLSLPLELRRIIILDVLKHRHHKGPNLSKQALDSRIKLRNRLDNNYPTETKIYVCKRVAYIHANALLQTNRMLRQDTLRLIEDTLKTGKVHIPFVLDLMIIKDVGLLPTWLSYPYQPEHVKKIKVIVRVFRPDQNIIPKTWISAAQYGRYDYPFEVSLCHWNLLVVFIFYAMGRLTASMNDTIHEQSSTELTRAMDTLHVGTRPPGVDVYISAKAPYSTDKLFIEVQQYERYANGKAVVPYVEDWHKSSPWYKEGNYSFGRTIFTDVSPEDDNYWYVERSLKSGTLVTWQLSSGIKVPFLHLSHHAALSEPWHTRHGYITMQIYLDAVVRNIRAVTIGYKEDVTAIVGGTGYWEGQLGSEFESDDVVTAFKREKKKKEPNEHILHWFRLVKRRMDLGWWDDEEYKRIWHNGHPNGWIYG